MKYLLIIATILLVACCSVEKKEPTPEVEVKKKEPLSVGECALIVNETKINLTLFVTENNLNGPFQIFANDMIMYLEKHVLFDLHTNEVVNRNINLSILKKHFVFLDEIMTPYLSKKDRVAIYKHMGKLLTLAKYQAPANEEELFDVTIVQGLSCYAFGIRSFLKRYEGTQVDEDEKKIYTQKSLDYIDVEILFGTKESTSTPEEQPEQTQPEPKNLQEQKSKENTPKEEDKSNYDITQNKSVQKITDTSKNKVQGKVDQTQNQAEKKAEDTISNTIDSILGNN